MAEKHDSDARIKFSQALGALHLKPANAISVCRGRKSPAFAEILSQFEIVYDAMGVMLCATMCLDSSESEISVWIAIGRKVAKQLNIAPNTLSQYEIGARDIPNGVLIALARLFDTSIGYLLELTDDPEPYARKRKK